MTNFWTISSTPSHLAARVPSDEISFSTMLDYDPGPVSLTEPEVRTWEYDLAQLPDWVWTEDALRLLSPRMRSVLEPFVTDAVQWIPVEVRSPSGSVDFFVPKFLSWPDVLDDEYTNYGPSGLPMRWVISREEARGRRVFTLREALFEIIVDQEVYDCLKRARLTGVDYTRTRVA